MIKSTWIAATSFLLAAACGSGASSELTGTNWSLQQLGEQVITPVPDSRPAFLRFGADDSRYGASAGCNQLGGSWSGGGGEIEFGPAVSTLMACEDSIMTRESSLGEVLRAATHYRIVDERLELLANGNVLASFAREPAQR